MERIEIYLYKSAGATGEAMGHLHADNSVTFSKAYERANQVLATRRGEIPKTFNPKNRAQALGGNLADASERIISAPRKMLSNANFGRNLFRGL